MMRLRVGLPKLDIVLSIEENLKIKKIRTTLRLLHDKLKNSN